MNLKSIFYLFLKIYIKENTSILKQFSRCYNMNRKFKRLFVETKTFTENWFKLGLTQSDLKEESNNWLNN